MLLRLCLILAFVLAAPAGAAEAAAPSDPFPRGFLWGVAGSGFQTEAGGDPAHADRRSDWWAWAHDAANIAAGRVSGDRVADGPGAWTAWDVDLRLARDELGLNAYRLGIEWSRIFPRSTASVRTSRVPTLAQLRRLHRLADRRALAHYRAVLQAVRARGMVGLVTLSHFSLPRWIHDPLAARDALARVGPDDPVPSWDAPRGWLDLGTVAEFRKYAAYLAWQLGDLVDIWTPLNEPMVVAVNGYANIGGALAKHFPPGALSYPAALKAVEQQALANAAAYGAVHALDRRGRRRTRVGLVHDMIAFTAADPASVRDQAAVAHAEHLFNRLFLDAAVHGIYDMDADGVEDPGERRAGLAGRADFIGVNYYFRGRVAGLGAPLSRHVGVLDFLPRADYASASSPDAPPCPTECSNFGWEIHPDGLRAVLATAGAYDLPVYITENGIADAADARRGAYLVRHLAVLRQAMADGLADVRGYFHRSLVDDFEWAVGYATRFGLYSYTPGLLRRTARPSARIYARIAGERRLAPDLLQRFGATR